MPKFDRKQFFDGYRNEFGKLSSIQVSGLNELLAFIEADKYITRIPYASYELATTKHETADTFHPIHEYGSKAYFIKRYGGQTKKGKELGNDTPDEGYYYAGQGYPQTTGESNFEKAEDAIRREYPEVVADFERRTGKVFDLTVGDQPNDENDPANMMDPAIAYVTMSYGMRKGMFTGHRMSDYLDEIPPDYKNARKIINGMDKANLIAGYARSFEKILTLAADPVDSALGSNVLLTPDPAVSSQPSSSDPPPTKQVTEQTQTEIVQQGTTTSATETKTTSDLNAAIEREEHPTFIGYMWKKVTAAITAIGGTTAVTNLAQQGQTFGLTPNFWASVIVIVAAVLTLWIITEAIKWFFGVYLQRQRTNKLAELNSTATNMVVIVPKDQLQKYEDDPNWVVIRRSNAK